MGLFDSKWIVEFEYSEGFFSSTKKATMVIEASSEYSAKNKAKAVLRGSYSYVKILSARKSARRIDEKNVTYKPKITREDLTSNSSETETYTDDYIERRLASMENANGGIYFSLVETPEQIKNKEILRKNREISKLKRSKNR